MKYKEEIRKNRKVFLQSVTGKNISKDEILLITRKVINIQNNTRGKLGELLGEIFLTSNMLNNRIILENDTATFETPFGKRRVDIYWRKKRISVEAKMGYVYASKSIINQIKKDRYLLKNNFFKKVIWLLIKGGSKRLKLILKNNNIEIIEGWPIKYQTK